MPLSGAVFPRRTERANHYSVEGMAVMEQAVETGMGPKENASVLLFAIFLFFEQEVSDGSLTSLFVPSVCSFTEWANCDGPRPILREDNRPKIAPPTGELANSQTGRLADW